MTLFLILYTIALLVIFIPMAIMSEGKLRYTENYNKWLRSENETLRDLLRKQLDCKELQKDIINLQEQFDSNKGESYT